MFTVMIVDDEPAAISTIKRNILKYSSLFELFLEAYSVEDAIFNLKNNKIDVIFTDIKMPGKNGVELVKYLSDKYPSILVIVVSSYDDYEYVRETFLHKIEDYLLKPVQPLKFKKILEHIEEKLVNCSTDSFSVEKESVKQRAVKTSTENLILEIENYLKQHLEEDNSMVKICKKFNISQPYLSKIFKKYKRCTYNDFLNQLKIEKAKKLLEEREDLLIGSIATLSGYTDQFYFSKVFKGNVGVTPTEFRKQLAESFSL